MKEFWHSRDINLLRLVCRHSRGPIGRISTLLPSRLPTCDTADCQSALRREFQGASWHYPHVEKRQRAAAVQNLSELVRLPLYAKRPGVRQRSAAFRTPPLGGIIEVRLASQDTPGPN